MGKGTGRDEGGGGWETLLGVVFFRFNDFKIKKLKIVIWLKG